MQPAQPMRRLKETREKNAQSNRITTYHHWIGNSCYSWSLFLVTFLPAAESKRWGESAFTGQCGKRGCCGRGLCLHPRWVNRTLPRWYPVGASWEDTTRRILKEVCYIAGLYSSTWDIEVQREEREGNYCIHIFCADRPCMRVWTYKQQLQQSTRDRRHGDFPFATGKPHWFSSVAPMFCGPSFIGWLWLSQGFWLLESAAPVRSVYIYIHIYILVMRLASLRPN